MRDARIRHAASIVFAGLCISTVGLLTACERQEPTPATPSDQNVNDNNTYDNQNPPPDNNPPVPPAEEPGGGPGNGGG